MQRKQPSTRHTLGQQIRAARKAKRVSLRKLAASVGCSFGFINDIEQGRRNASPDIIRNLARALGVSPDPMVRASNLERIARLKARFDARVEELTQ